MYQIALCDDETIELDKAEKLLEAYNQEHRRFAFSIKRFEHVEDFLDAVKEEHYEPNLLLIDIYMPEKLGIEVAKELRAMGKRFAIIFLTVSREHALDAFSVDAAQYLLKPISEETLFPVLNKLLENLEEEQKKCILLEGNGRIYRITLRDIVYCEAQRKSQCIYMSNGTILTLRMTMTKIYEKLSEFEEFVKVGVAYVVNLEHIESLNTQELLMDNGERIFLPRGAHKILREQYFDYYCQEKG